MEQVKNIFILDDDDISLRFIQQAFGRTHNIQCFKDEKTCGNALTQTTPDIIIIDYNLEQGTGLDFYEDHQQLLQDVEIIFLSSQQDLTVIFEIINSGIGRYVIKDESMLKCLECLFEGDLETYEELL